MTADTLSRYRQARAEGRCHRCRGPSPAAAYCPACVAKYRDWKRSRIAAGYCTSCRHRKAEPGKSRCAPCSASRKETSRMIRDNWRAAGLCSSCGQQPRESDRKLCGTCLDRARRRSKAKYQPRKGRTA